MRGLQSAVDQVQSYGRGPDTMLAHITPDESHVIDYLQGGRKTNPVTGLPEYSMFGDILKAVARAAAGIGGFMVGGPAGAAAGSAAATKLTGGSWKDALSAAAFSGIGSLGAQGLGGGGWSPFGAKAAETAGTTLNTAMGEMAIPDISIAAGPQGVPGSFGEFMSAAKSSPGIAAGLGGLSAPLSNPAQAPAPQMPEATKINLNVKPQPREYMPYQGDPLHFAEPTGGGMAPGMGHKFYSPLLPIPQYQDEMPQVQGQGQQIEGLGYANGGHIRRFAMGGGLQMPAMPGLPQPGAQGADIPGQPGGALRTPNIRAAAMAGYNAFAKGGAPHEGPVRGPGTGTSDSIPARLSNGEHVMTAREIDALGGGDNEAGQTQTYKLRRAIKKNPAKVRAMIRGLGAA